MSDLLMREHAPVTPEAWEQIDDEARRVLKLPLAGRKLVGKRTACVHVAGALGPEALESIRASCAGVAQMHPMISFASTQFQPSLDRGQLHVDGDDMGYVLVQSNRNLVPEMPGLTGFIFRPLAWALRHLPPLADIA